MVVYILLSPPLLKMFFRNKIMTKHQTLKISFKDKTVTKKEDFRIV